MNEWIRDEGGGKAFEKLLSPLVLFAIISIFIMQYEAAAVLSMLAGVIGLQHYYFKQMGKGLWFDNTRVRKRTISGTASYWELVFTNTGLPIWNAKLTITFQDAIRPTGMDIRENHSALYEVTVPFTIGRKEKVQLRIPVEGVKRGLSKIKKLEVEIPHPFSEGSLRMQYGKYLMKEHIVYPPIHVITDPWKPASLKPGHYDDRHSVYDDPYLPVGTRDYLPTDQFQHIHWKATARMQSLQTKVFTKVSNQSVLFVLNAQNRYSIIPDLEEKLERLASYAEYCYRNGIPYSIAINIRTFGKSPFIYLPTGDGAIQRQRAMDVLASISQNDMTMPFSHMLKSLQVREGLPVMSVVMTHGVSTFTPILNEWRKETNLHIEGTEIKGGAEWRIRQASV